MERLTKRDRKGHAYFDNDGMLIRGANGKFHQKKDMTGQYIHDRFVALDKTIDRLAAYEDSNCTPEEIIDLQQAWDMYGGETGITAMLEELEHLRKELQNTHDPLTLEELQEMVGEPVYIYNGYNAEYAWQIVERVTAQTVFFTDGTAHWVSSYGGRWLAYRQKPAKALEKPSDICAVTGAPCCKCNPGPCDSRITKDGVR